MYLQSEDCHHGISDFIQLGGTWYPFCTECKMVVEVEVQASEDVMSLEEAVKKIVKNMNNSEHNPNGPCHCTECRSYYAPRASPIRQSTKYN